MSDELKPATGNALHEGKLKKHRGRPKDPNPVYQFRVPDADIIVNKWIRSQANLGFSLRLIIKKIVSMYGLSDVTCISLDDVPFQSGGTGFDTGSLNATDNDKLLDDHGDTDQLPPDQIEYLKSVGLYKSDDRSFDNHDNQPVNNKISDRAAPVAPVIDNGDIMSMFGQEKKPLSTVDDNDGFVDPDDIL